MKNCSFLFCIILCCFSQVWAICLPKERERVHTMMQEADKPYEIYFSELCARNYSGIQLKKPNAYRVCSDGTEVQLTYAEYHLNARCESLHDIFVSDATAAQKAEAYSTLLAQQPEQAEEWMENLLLEYYLCGCVDEYNVLKEPVPHTREELSAMAEHVFRAPGINWDARGANKMTAAGILFRFVMSAPDCEPIADLFCRYADFDETCCLYDHPAIALAVMADCPGAVRMLLARGRVTADLAAYCISRMPYSHGRVLTAHDIAEKYCGCFYLNHDGMYTGRLKLRYCSADLRPKSHGHEILQQLLPLVPEPCRTAAPLPPCEGDFTVQDSYAALQQMCPSLLPPLVAVKSPKAASTRNYFPKECEEEASLPNLCHLEQCSEQEVEQAVQRMAELLRADSVTSIYIPDQYCADESLDQELDSMYESAYMLYHYMARHRALPACVQQGDSVYKLLEDDCVIRDLVEAEEEDTELSREEEAEGRCLLAEEAHSFAASAAYNSLMYAREVKWQSLLAEQTRVVDFVLSLPLQGNEKEVRMTLSAANPQKVLAVHYEREGGGGSACNKVLRFLNIVPIGSSAVANLNVTGESRVIVCGDPFYIMGDGEFELVSDITAHLGKHVRCVYYQDDYENTCGSLLDAVMEYTPDGTVLESPVYTVTPGQRPLRLVVELKP